MIHRDSYNYIELFLFYYWYEAKKRGVMEIELFRFIHKFKSFLI